MITSSAVLPLSRFAKAPLFAGLALVLGSSLAWSASVTASAGVPFILGGNAPATRTGLHLGDQRAALNRQLAMRDAPAHVAPNRPAAIVTVSNCEDSGAGSLRDAFLNAVSGDVIDLTSLDCSTITLNTGLSTSVDDLTLTGPGADLLAIDGNNASRIIEHLGYGMLTIDGLTIRNGSYVYSGPGIYGGLAPGACVLSKKSVTITGSVIDHCGASGWSVFGGAVNALGALYMIDSTVSGTTSTAEATEISATVYGGAVYAAAAYVTGSTVDGAEIIASSTSAFSGMLGGGIFGFYGVILDHSRVSGVTAHVSGAKIAYAKGAGVASPNTIIMTSSTVSGNSVHGTPGVGASGPYVYTSAIGGGGVYIMTIPRSSTYPSSITNSTISNNSAICDGDIGQYTVGGGGGLGTWTTKPVTITNSTISGNTTDTHGGGLYTRNMGSLVLANSTVTDNTAPDGAGIDDNGSQSPYDLVTNSSIVAGNNLPGGTPLAEIVTVHSITGANNLVGSANVALPGDTLGGDPLLAPLADNGGPTLTHALLAGSPAIDTGSNLASLTSDQRGDGYVRVSGAAADIGAFESQPAPDVVFANGFD
jgi:hypothetical protein